MDKNLTLVLIGIGVFIAWQLMNRDTAPAGISNHEVWKWTDYRGNDRQIVIEREVKIS